MRRVITGFNATNAAQGQRLGFTYTEMTDSGTRRHRAILIG